MSEQAAAAPPRRSLPMQVIVPILAVFLGLGLGVVGSGMLGSDDKAQEGAPEGEGQAAAGGEAAPAAGGGEHGAAPAGEQGGAAAEGGGHGGGGATAAGVVTNPDGTAITSLGTFTVNLRGSGGGRVLRLEVQVESRGADVETINGRMARVRDAVITAASDYTWPELEGTDGKTRLRDELLARINGALSPVVIEHIYFTQFVVQ
jgi:flagellar basal body-associated protein FliL